MGMHADSGRLNDLSVIGCAFTVLKPKIVERLDEAHRMRAAPEIKRVVDGL
jgi:hypothetical protein